MPRLALTLAGLLLVLSPAAPADAYVIQSGFTDGCHEWITAHAFVDSELLNLVEHDRITLPDGDASTELGELLNERLVDGMLTEAQRFALFSLVVGVRDVDTWGGSVTDIEPQRQIHADPRPRGQYVHALRAPEDDEPDGTRNAIAGTRAVIEELVSAAVASSRKPPSEQLVWVSITLDFYGRFDVEVWAPGFLLGQAAHALQDSFSHSIRSTDGLHEIVHVLNFVDAIYTTFEETRDGMAHSRYLDKCFETDVVELTEAARDASVWLFDAFSGAQMGDETAISAVLDAWLVQADCELDDPSCVDPKWLDAARNDPSRPLLPEGLICSAHPLTNRAAVLSMVGWLCLALITLHLIRRRSHRGHEP